MAYPSCFDAHYDHDAIHILVFERFPDGSNEQSESMRAAGAAPASGKCWDESAAGATASTALALRLLQLAHLMLQPTAFEALIAQRAFGCLHPPIQPQDGIAWPPMWISAPPPGPVD
jgi:hypothetical protein